MTVSTLGNARVVADVRGMERAEWLALRRTGIGGSDAAAICGQSKYRSALEVWLDKTGVIGDDDIDNEAMWWGRTLEPLVARKLAEKTLVNLWPVGALLAHPEHEWMLASPDRGACDPDGSLGLAELKTAGYFPGQEWKAGNVPDAYVLQAMHYMACCDLPWCLFGCLVAGQNLVPIKVERDDELIALLMDREAEFWQQVTERTPPPPDGSKATSDLLAALWDVKTDAVAVLDPEDVDPIIELRNRAAASEKEAKELKAQAENQLRWLIGENEIAQGPDGRKLYTWRQHDRDHVDLDGLRAEAPELVAKHTTQTAQRRLYIPRKKA